MSMSQEMNLEELSQYFHLPINEVAQQLGVCTTVLKKMCRNNGLERWPHRKIKSIDGLIESLETLIATEPEDKESLCEELNQLYKKREYILANPNVVYKSVVPKHLINNLNARIQKEIEIDTTSKASTTNSPKKSSWKDISPKKTIQKKSVKSSYRTRLRKENQILCTSQENLVVSTLANIKTEMENDLAIFNEFVQNLHKFDVSNALDVAKNQQCDPSHQITPVGLLCGQ